MVAPPSSASSSKRNVPMRTMVTVSLVFPNLFRFKYVPHQARNIGGQRRSWDEQKDGVEASLREMGGRRHTRRPPPITVTSVWISWSFISRRSCIRSTLRVINPRRMVRPAQQPKDGEGSACRYFRQAKGVAGDCRQSAERGKNVTSKDVEHARQFGASDLEIHDTVLIAAAFCMYNGYVDGLDTVQPKEPERYASMGKHLAEHGYLK
jgi:hypothetical protein